VFPGHGYNDLLFSTIETERELNPALAHDGPAAYAASLGAVPGAGNSAAVNGMLVLNLEADPELPDAPTNAAACCASPSAGGELEDVPELHPRDAQTAHASIINPAQWVDVREPHEWQNGRIPGTTHIPLSELGFHLERLRGHAPLYLSCRSGVRSNTAAKTLRRLGVALDPVNVGGGILAWQSMGNPIEGQPAS